MFTYLQDSPWSGDMPVSHGNYFYYAYKEGLLAPNNSNIVRAFGRFGFVLY